MSLRGGTVGMPSKGQSMVAISSNTSACNQMFQGLCNDYIRPYLSLIAAISHMRQATVRGMRCFSCGMSCFECASLMLSSALGRITG